MKIKTLFSRLTMKTVINCPLLEPQKFAPRDSFSRSSSGGETRPLIGGRSYLVMALKPALNLKEVARKWEIQSRRRLVSRVECVRLRLTNVAVVLFSLYRRLSVVENSSGSSERICIYSFQEVFPFSDMEPT